MFTREKDFSNTCARTQYIIKTAFLKLVGENGFNSVSVCDILDEAKISRTTFYRYYEDKYLLLKEIQDEYAICVSQFILALIKNESPALYSAMRNINAHRAYFFALESVTDNDYSLKNEFYKICSTQVKDSHTSLSANMLSVASALVYSCVYYLSTQDFKQFEFTENRTDDAVKLLLKNFSDLFITSSGMPY